MGGVPCGTGIFRTPTTIIIISKLVTKPNVVEFVILWPKFARMALSWVARQRVVGQKLKNDNNRFWCHMWSCIAVVFLEFKQLRSCCSFFLHFRVQTTECVDSTPHCTHACAHLYHTTRPSRRNDYRFRGCGFSVFRMKLMRCHRNLLRAFFLELVSSVRILPVFFTYENVFWIHLHLPP